MKKTVKKTQNSIKRVLITFGIVWAVFACASTVINIIKWL